MDCDVVRNGKSHSFKKLQEIVFIVHTLEPKQSSSWLRWVGYFFLDKTGFHVRFPSTQVISGKQCHHASREKKYSQKHVRPEVEFTLT